MKSRPVFLIVHAVTILCLSTGCVGIGGGPSLLDILLFPCIISGCFIPPCDVGNTLVQMDASSIPIVPDQEFTGCFEVSIVRTFESDAERELIQRAEDLASTIGPTWVSTTAMLGYYEGNGEPAYLIGDALATNAVTSEALVYYTFRILTYQTSTERGNIRGGLTYTARVVDQPVGANFQSAARRTIVRLTLGYSEWYGPLAAAGIYVWREVEFDEAGDVIEVRGDGDVSTSVS